MNGLYIFFYFFILGMFYLFDAGQCLSLSKHSSFEFIIVYFKLLLCLTRIITNSAVLEEKLLHCLSCWQLYRILYK